MRERHRNPADSPKDHSETAILGVSKARRTSGTALQRSMRARLKDYPAFRAQSTEEQSMLDGLFLSGEAGALAHIRWEKGRKGTRWAPRIRGDMLPVDKQAGPHDEGCTSPAEFIEWCKITLPREGEHSYRPLARFQKVLRCSTLLQPGMELYLHPVSTPEGSRWNSRHFGRMVDAYLLASCFPQEQRELTELGAISSRVCLPSAEELWVKALQLGCGLYVLDWRLYCPSLPCLLDIPSKVALNIEGSYLGMDTLVVGAGLLKHDGVHYQPSDFAALARDTLNFRMWDFETPWHLHYKELYVAMGDSFPEQNRGTQLGFSTMHGGAANQANINCPSYLYSHSYSCVC